MKVLMIPHIEHYRANRDESGIRRVVEAYFKYLPEQGVELVKPNVEDFDLAAIHAGAGDASGLQAPLVAHIHGLYWTQDYRAAKFEWASNAHVINSIRRARTITVPSDWVAETIRRDVRVNPHIVPHGIDWQAWQDGPETSDYVLWNKNRKIDVCSPEAVGALALAFPKIPFITTFAPEITSPNVKAIGIVPHKNMKKIVQQALVYLSTTKETFGIGVLEALASGVPVLGFAHGGNLDTVKHGVDGYLARPGDYDDLKRGLDYCVKYRSILSANARELSKQWTWERVAEQLAGIYHEATRPIQPTVAVVIPCFNYGDDERLGRAVRSALDQTYRVDRVVVVDDGSTSGDAQAVVDRIDDGRVALIRQNNSGVAIARNNGIDATDATFICCLDADDWIERQFVEACVSALREDVTLGIAYTGLTAHSPDGRSRLSEWPGPFDYERELERHNCIPTACVFRREMYERLGGYRQRYAPHGAGAEDGEFWLRAGAYGWNAQKVTDAGMFHYSLGTGQVSGDRNYREIDYTAFHPWTKDGKHPFASVAKPKFYSHPVRQYDKPEVSVIIPVGPGHEDRVWNALDSLESQVFRNWEAIVVWDSANLSKIDRLKRVYPYVKLVLTGNRGAGYARNRGVEIARAPLLLFLDADDTLVPECLSTMLMAYNDQEAVIYSDHVGKAFVKREDIKRNDVRLLEYDEKTEEAVFEGKALDYVWDRAVAQPSQDLYLWCNVSSLVPKEWHDEICGFDESMPSWEDWDYWIRLARCGKCFVHVTTPLFVYRFYSGSRRERGLNDYPELINYMLEKYKGEQPMPCNCGNKKRFNVAATAQAAQAQAQRAPAIDKRAEAAEQFGVPQDTDVVYVQYAPNRRGAHRVIGQKTGRDYGYRDENERFYVIAADQALNPEVFRIIDVERKAESVSVPETPPPVAVGAGNGTTVDTDDLLPFEEEDHEKPFDLQLIPGVSPQISAGLQAMGAHTIDDVVKLGEDQLIQIKGVGIARARAILKWLAEQQVKA